MNTSKTLRPREGGQVYLGAVTWLGDVTPVKISGRRREAAPPETITRWKFAFRILFVPFDSQDYETEEEARRDHARALSFMVGEQK